MAETPDHPCCAPKGDVPRRDKHTTPAARFENSASVRLREDCLQQMLPVKGGVFDMGTRKSQYADDLDSPVRKVKVSPFQLSKVTVTNALFGAFVSETDYVTTAEREGWSFVFQGFLANPDNHPDYARGTPWWRRVDGAYWAAPEGPSSTIEARMDHPVTHVSWYDATAFCGYLGLRLPTEAEWEFAARGGLKGSKHPWGHALVPTSGHAQNTWQGDFPAVNTAEDGYAGTAPVDAFAPNDFGFFNMTGNIWEWSADWFGPLPEGKVGRPPKDPTGAKSGPGRAMRGGSHLCHVSYCERYYVHSRTWNTPDSSTGHIGFRVAL